MRIVGGRFRGRGLATPRGNAIRPTTDRTREALFNILMHGHTQALSGRVLDLGSIAEVRPKAMWMGRARFAV